jgi:hypothetical protein
MIRDKTSSTEAAASGPTASPFDGFSGFQFIEKAFMPSPHEKTLL